MKPILLPLILALAGAAVPPEHDILFDAMSDELTRTVSQLKIEKHAKPYYVSYRIDDCDNLYVAASFGAITGESETRGRSLTVDVHVGNYELDSGNMRARYALDWDELSSGSLSLDDDYDAIRHRLWLETDRAYKKAVRNFEKKKALLQQKSIKERPDDWSREQPVVLVQPRHVPPHDRAGWKTRIRDLSSIFRDYPQIRQSSVTFTQTNDNKYFVNNEGSKSRVIEGDCSISVSALAQAKDGTKIRDRIVIEASDAQHMLPNAQLQERIRQFAQRLTATVEAKEAELYQGPVLLEGEAAAEFLSKALAPSLVVKRPPESDGSTRTEDAVMGRIGWRILPKFISVEDDPTLKDSSGDMQPASFYIDDQGVAPKKVLLVNKGILKTLLSSRLPTLKVKDSNGHALGGSNVAQVSNLIVQSDAKVDPADAALDPEKLKAKLIEFGKEDGLDYVLIVRKLSSAESISSMGSYAIDLDTGSESRKEQIDLPMAVDISRLYLSDGHEEQLRGAEFATTTVRILRNIAATGDDSKIYQQGSTTSGDWDSQPSSYRPVSVTTPSLILRDIEMQKPHADQDKIPTLPHPYFEKTPTK